MHARVQISKLHVHIYPHIRTRGTAKASEEGGWRGGAAAGAGRGRAAHSSIIAESCPSSEGIVPLSELSRRYLQQRRGAASHRRARARTRPALAAALPLATGCATDTPPRT